MLPTPTPKNEVIEWEMYVKKERNFACVNHTKYNLLTRIPNESFSLEFFIIILNEHGEFKVIIMGTR